MRDITLGQQLRRLDVGSVVVTETLHSPDVKLGRHDHEFANVNVVLSGNYLERVEMADFTCMPGTVVVKPAGAAHSNRYGNAVTHCIAIEVTAAALLQRSRLFDRARHVVHAPLGGIANDLSLELRYRTPMPLIVEGLALQLLGAFERDSAVETGTAMPVWLRQAREMIDSGTRISVSAIATQLQVDSAHLSRAFRRYVGVSISTYARRVRIERCKTLLERSNLRLAEIASEAGFADQSHFTRVFREAVGITPREFRRTKKSRPF